MITTRANTPRIDRDDTAIMNHSGRNKNRKKFNRNEGFLPGSRIKPVSYCNTIFLSHKPLANLGLNS